MSLKIYMGSHSIQSLEAWIYKLEQKALNDTLQSMPLKGAACSVFIEEYLHCQACIDYCISAFEMIEDETRRNIVTDKLLNRMTLEQLCDKYNFSDRHIRRLYKSGIEELEKALGKC